MAKLYFKYGVMGAAKTAEALMCKYRYEETGQKAILLKTSTATRDGDNIVRSRIGLQAEARNLEEYLSEGNYGKVDAIIVDEVQFATPEQIDKLAEIVDCLDIPVICYGLKNDKDNHLFEGSKRLIEICDSMTEIKTVCSKCGSKAIYNIKLSGDDINGKYISVCRKCFKKIERR
jgi:thymidine kinase